MAEFLKQLYFQQSGDRTSPAILFLHGSPLSSRMWEPQLAGLRDEFHCLAPDLPEHGQSADVQPFEMQDTVRRLVRLIRAECPQGKAHVVGLSFGGVVAQALVSRVPEVVESLVLSGTAVRMNGFLLNLLKFQMWANQPILKLMPADQVANLMLGQFAIPDKFRSMLMEDVKRVSPEAMTRFVVSSYAGIETPVTPGCRVLVCVGGRETFLARRMANQLAGQISGAKFLQIPRLGHVWNLQDANLFNRILRAWVQNQTLPEV